jgi:hypothetical protein
MPVLSGCWLFAAGGAGVYGGYKTKEGLAKFRKLFNVDFTLSLVIFAC